jgi:hypothetical protein
MVAPEYRNSLASAGKPKGEGKPDPAAKSPGETGGKDAAAEAKAPSDPKDAAAMEHAKQRAAQKAPKNSKAQGDHKKQKNHSEHGQVWVKDGSLAKPIKVRIGASDGIDTEVSGPEIKEGMEVIVGELTPDQAADLSNPFAPKIFNRTGGPPKTRP